MLHRQGYGSAFNELYIDGKYIIKRARNEYGSSKLLNEYNLYLYIKKYCNDFPIPGYIEYKNGLKLTYYKDYTPLYKVYPNIPTIDRLAVYKLIETSLGKLHSMQIVVDKKQIFDDLQIETEGKLLERVSEIKGLISEYSYIKYVNNIKVLTFEECLAFIKEKIIMYIEERDTYSYSPIHGDCQFNNILIDSSYKNIIFIDPRGYFGKTKIFGMPEYDTAKVQFALSGYDILDNMTVESLKIEGDHLYLPKISIDDNLLGPLGIVRWLLCSIWLGNAHCFKNQPLKAIFSYYYALYICSLAKIDDKSSIR
jgi:hypothetical protein